MRNIFERNAVREIQVHVQYTSRPEIQVQMNDRAEARRQGLALGNYRTELLLQALQRNNGTITVAKCGQWFRFMQTETILTFCFPLLFVIITQMFNDSRG